MAAAVKLNLRRQPPSYGIDAPGLVRTLFVTGALALIVALSAGHSPWPGGLVAGALSALAWFVSAYALGMGCSMLYGSLVAKVRGRDQLLGLVPWSGSETVLDVGCGRGLLLMAAARRLPFGRAVGIDVWRAKDQSGNRSEATLANCPTRRPPLRWWCRIGWSITWTRQPIVPGPWRRWPASSSPGVGC